MRISYIILLQCLIFSYTYSQVTIGSGIAPNKGALLDLKENSVVNGANSSKGLILPRVNLYQEKSLIDISDVAYTETTEQVAHAGLVVYNTNQDFYKGKGIYCWDGTQWISLKPETITITIDKIVYKERSYFMGMLDSKLSIIDLSLLAIIPSDWNIISYNNPYINAGNRYNVDTGIFKVQETGIYDILARYDDKGLNIIGSLGLAILIRRANEADQGFKVLVHDTRPILISTAPSREVSYNNLELNAGDEIAFAIKSNDIADLAVVSSRSSYAIIKQR